MAEADREKRQRARKGDKHCKRSGYLAADWPARFGFTQGLASTSFFDRTLPCKPLKAISRQRTNRSAARHLKKIIACRNEKRRTQVWGCYLLLNLNGVAWAAPAMEGAWSLYFNARKLTQIKANQTANWANWLHSYFVFGIKWLLFKKSWKSTYHRFCHVLALRRQETPWTNWTAPRHQDAKRENPFNWEAT